MSVVSRTSRPHRGGHPAAHEELESWFKRIEDDPDISATATDYEHESTVTDRVVLSTIHAAKGREWDAVAVLGPMNGMPDRRAVNVGDLEEERRVAYVAATRARERLLFCCSDQYASELDCDKTGLSWASYKRKRMGLGRVVVRAADRAVRTVAAGLLSRFGRQND